ncbi:MAG TPA: adenylyl-sulfate kinase [Flavobacteriales bacterium]|nr:adenylyl-sulfate kinase [Flavobacteriales bacterium]HIN40336.1 adenylyl-sulfate kinase [Flavobacteriales bacterium]
MNSSQNIFPDKRVLRRSDKEKILKQRAKAIWLTGLSGSGKTTLAIELENALIEKGFFTQILDGDIVRMGINNNLGFSEKDRKENIRRVAEVSKLFINCGIITINCFVSPTIVIRREAKNIIGVDDFIEVFINTPLEICEKRDVKGLYAKARKGEVLDFTGVNAPWEEPENADINVFTNKMTVAESLKSLINQVIPLVTQA